MRGACPGAFPVGEGPLPIQALKKGAYFVPDRPEVGERFPHTGRIVEFYPSPTRFEQGEAHGNPVIPMGGKVYCLRATGFAFVAFNIQAIRAFVCRNSDSAQFLDRCRYAVTFFDPQVGYALDKGASFGKGGEGGKRGYQIRAVFHIQRGPMQERRVHRDSFFNLYAGTHLTQAVEYGPIPLQRFGV